MSKIIHPHPATSEMPDNAAAHEARGVAPADYQKFIKQVQAQQAKYISDQQRKMAKARRLWFRYKAAMAGMGLHPLSLDEIHARELQLEQMRKAIPETHGDSPTMRWSYERRLAELA